jgi:hypothetical protein
MQLQTPDLSFVCDSSFGVHVRAHASRVPELEVHLAAEFSNYSGSAGAQ